MLANGQARRWRIFSGFANRHANMFNNLMNWYLSAKGPKLKRLRAINLQIRVLRYRRMIATAICL